MDFGNRGHRDSLGGPGLYAASVASMPAKTRPPPSEGESQALTIVAIGHAAAAIGMVLFRPYHKWLLEIVLASWVLALLRLVPIEAHDRKDPSESYPVAFARALKESVLLKWMLLGGLIGYAAVLWKSFR